MVKNSIWPQGPTVWHTATSSEAYSKQVSLFLLYTHTHIVYTWATWCIIVICLIIGDIVPEVIKFYCSMYGCLGFSNSRFYAKSLAELITSQVGSSLFLNCCISYLLTACLTSLFCFVGKGNFTEYCWPSSEFTEPGGFYVMEFAVYLSCLN